MLTTVPFPDATRDTALSALRAFLPRAGVDYAKRRNFDFGPDNRGNVSMLSPYIRHRILLEEEVLKGALGMHSRDAADKFVQEIFWRAYFKGWLEQHPGVWQNYRHDLDDLLAVLDSDAALAARYDAATGAGTGIDCFDAWARELVKFGYLHNHARMWFASIWTFTLELPWQLGADFFLRHLLDGDPASNTLGWRWVAGLHTKGKTYLARVSNITSYTDGRFNPQGQLAVSAPPRTERHDLRRRPLPVCEAPDPDRPWALLVTEDDASMETLPFTNPPGAVIGLVATAARSPLPVGQPAAAFAEGAVTDGVERAAQKFGLDDATILSDPGGGALADALGEAGIERLVAPYAPVGPTAETLASLEPALCDAGIGLSMLRRGYDERAWPHASHGYFRLKKRIPALLDAL